MVLFALSCVGLLLFLWLSFGGTIPFNPQGYRIEATFPNAFDLADQADVRIAGVTVGKVVSKQISPKSNGTLVTMQLDKQYSPIRRNAQAILRTKTLLGVKLSRTLLPPRVTVCVMGAGRPGPLAVTV